MEQSGEICGHLNYAENQKHYLKVLVSLEEEHYLKQSKGNRNHE